MPKFRDGNPLPCGCGLKGTPYLDPHGDRGYEHTDLFIEFCPMHREAPEAYRHLAALSVTLTHHREHGKCVDPCTKCEIETLLKQAEAVLKEAGR